MIKQTEYPFNQVLPSDNVYPAMVKVEQPGFTGDVWEPATWVRKLDDDKVLVMMVTPGATLTGDVTFYIVEWKNVVTFC